MSNAAVTSRTKVITIRIPHDLLAEAVARANGPKRTSAVIVQALRAQWRVPSAHAEPAQPAPSTSPK